MFAWEWHGRRPARAAMMALHLAVDKDDSYTIASERGAGKSGSDGATTDTLCILKRKWCAMRLSF